MLDLAPATAGDSSIRRDLEIAGYRCEPHDGRVCLGLYRHPDRPGRILKLVDAGVDGFAAYAEACHHRRLEASPHFLRVFGISRVSVDRWLVEIEDLVPVSHLCDDEIAAIARRAWRYLTGFDAEPPTALDAAAAQLFAVFGLAGMTPDLRPNNLMARLCPDGGAVLVINDPYGRRHRRPPD